MAFVTGDSLVAAIQRKLCFAVVEVRGLPTLGAVAARAVGLRLLVSELFSVDIGMAGFANQGSALEHDFRLSRGSFVTCVASDGPMNPQQREFRLRVVESRDVDPRSGVVAGLAAELGPIRPAAFLPIAELSVMRVLVATRAGFVVKGKRNDFVFSPASSDFMAFGATNRGVRAGQRELGLAMLGDGKQTAVPIRYRVAALAAVLERRFRKLAVVGVFVAVRTGRELHLVNRLFAGRKVALVAFHFGVLSFERILRSGMFLDAKQRRLPSLHFVALGTLPFLRAVGELAVMNILVAVGAVRKLERTLEVPAYVASNAIYFTVFAEQRVFCFGVIELERR